MLRRGIPVLVLAGRSGDCDDRMRAMDRLPIRALVARMAEAMVLRLLRLLRLVLGLLVVEGRSRGG